MSKELEKLGRQVSFRSAQGILRNYNGVVVEGACLLTGITVTAKGANGTADIYDGVNDNGEHKVEINVINNTTFALNNIYPMPMDYGIYLKVNANTTYVMIQYIPLVAGYPE